MKLGVCKKSLGIRAGHDESRTRDKISRPLGSRRPFRIASPWFLRLWSLFFLGDHLLGRLFLPWALFFFTLFVKILWWRVWLMLSSVIVFFFFFQPNKQKLVFAEKMKVVSHRDVFIEKKLNDFCPQTAHTCYKHSALAVLTIIVNTRAYSLEM